MCHNCQCDLTVASSYALASCNAFPDDNCPDYVAPSTVIGDYGNTLDDVLVCRDYYVVFDKIDVIHAAGGPAPYNPLTYNYAVDGPYDPSAYPELTPEFINVIRFADYTQPTPSIPKRWKLPGVNETTGWPPGSPFGRDGIGSWRLLKDWPARSGPRVGHNPHIGNHPGSGGVFWHLSGIRLFINLPLWEAIDKPHPDGTPAETPPNLAVYPTITGYFAFIAVEWNGTEWEMFNWPDIGQDTAYGGIILLDIGVGVNYPEIPKPAKLVVPKGPFPTDSARSDSLYPNNQKPPACPDYGCSGSGTKMRIGPPYRNERTVVEAGKNLGSALDPDVVPNWNVDFGPLSPDPYAGWTVGWLDLRAHVEVDCGE